MKANLVAFAVGIVFAVGLVLGGMTQPSKVVGFLDFFGNWDPSLAFVMGGAIMANVGLYWWTIKKRPQPVFDSTFHIGKNSHMSPRIIAGSALFGIGWGLSGFCPGPALTSVATATGPVLVFVAAMAAGVYLFRAVEGRSQSASSGEMAPALAGDS
ncbi:MAG: DUF6691 family protein [Bradymonadaceae bacterium]